MDTKQYLSLARKIAPYDRSLNKYKRRKTLSAQEKGAITKARNKFKDIVDINQSLNRVKSLNKTQIKALKDKSLLIPGTNSILVDPNARDVRIEKGDVVVKSGQFKFHYQRTADNPDALIDAAAIIFERENKRYDYFVAIWFKAGAYNYKSPLSLFIEQVDKTFKQAGGYNVPDTEIEGIAWYRAEK